MHILSGGSRRALVASIAVAAFLAAGCGTPARPASGRALRPVSASPSASPLASPSPPAPRAPTPRYADPLDRYAYREAFGRCATLGVAAVADAYGATSSAPSSAASAYAEHSFPETTRYRQAAVRGCLDGFSDRT